MVVSLRKTQVTGASLGTTGDSFLDAIANAISNSSSQTNGLSSDDVSAGLRRMSNSHAYVAKDQAITNPLSTAIVGTANTKSSNIQIG